MAADYRRGMDDQTTIFIDNEHVAAEATDRITVINPATEETIGSVPDCGPADIDRAVASSVAAFKGEWRRWTPTSALRRCRAFPRRFRLGRRSSPT